MVWIIAPDIRCMRHQISSADKPGSDFENAFWKRVAIVMKRFSTSGGSSQPCCPNIRPISLKNSFSESSERRTCQVPCVAPDRGEGAQRGPLADYQDLPGLFVGRAP